MKKNWTLYPERDYRGDGSVVAVCYLNDEKNFPIGIIRGYSKFYRVEGFGLKSTYNYINYDDTQLQRLYRKLLRKEAKGQLTSEQYTKIVLLAVCNMAEKYI